jgi:hypothetical protein
MQYAPADLRPPPAEHGFSVRRSYEGVEAPEDVSRDDKGVWHIKAGTKVRVRLGMVAPGRRYHVALVDPIPAGLEAMNPALAVTGTVPQDPKAEVSPTWWWSRAWYEHQNMRDERVEAFASLLYEGVYDYSYVARATTPGTFVVPHQGRRNVRPRDLRPRRRRHRRRRVKPPPRAAPRGRGRLRGAGRGRAAQGRGGGRPRRVQRATASWLSARWLWRRREGWTWSRRLPNHATNPPGAVHRPSEVHSGSTAVLGQGGLFWRSAVRGGRARSTGP